MKLPLSSNNAREMKVLVIEDDARLAEVLERGLQEAGHEVELRRDGLAGVEAALTGDHDAIVLDWMLPHRDGPSICRELRRRGNHTPLLMLTARHAVGDKVAGLDAGADDYLTKPFEFEELLARLRVFSRQRQRRELVRVGDLVIDHNRRAVRRGESVIELTAREFDLLAMLADRAGTVVSRHQILDEVWDGESDLRSNALDVHIANLRAKIDRPFNRNSLRTVRGVGFKLVPDAT
jgi:DNA-binding response OmpR family regulator